MTDSNQKEEKRPLPPAREPDNIAGEDPPLEKRQEFIDRYHQEHGIRPVDTDISSPIPHTPSVPPLRGPGSRQR
jgi:hypothetical protein